MGIETYPVNERKGTLEMSKGKKQVNISSEEITVTLAGLAALALVYLIFPSIAALAAPDAQKVLWTSPLSVRQGLSLLAGFVAVWMALNLANSIHRMKTQGGFEIPIWVIVGAFAVVCVALSVAVMVFAFSVTFTTLVTFGVESAIAAVVALLSATIAAYVLR